MTAEEREVFLASLVRQCIAAPITDVDALGRVAGGLKTLIYALTGFPEAAWVHIVRAEWGDLDIIYALATDEGRTLLTGDESDDIRGLITGIRESLPEAPRSD